MALVASLASLARIMVGSVGPGAVEARESGTMDASLWLGSSRTAPHPEMGLIRKTFQDAVID